MADLLVVKAKIKDVISDYNVAGDFAEALNAVAVEAVGCVDDKVTIASATSFSTNDNSFCSKTSGLVLGLNICSPVDVVVSSPAPFPNIN